MSEMIAATTGIVYDLQGFALFRRIHTTPFRPSVGVRGGVMGFSQRSAARMRRYLRTCKASYSTFITLTYPADYPRDGLVFKNHLRNFILRCRRRAEHSGHGDRFSVFWFMEFQNRGAPHFHLFCTERIPKEMVAAWWAAIVNSDDARHLHAGTRIESIRSGRYGMVSYASKYAAKIDQKMVPADVVNCGRFWGIAGLRDCVSATIMVSAEHVKNPIYLEFKQVLKELLLRNREKVFQMRIPSSYTLGFRLQSEELSDKVLGIMCRYMIKMKLAGIGDGFIPTDDLDLNL